MGGTPRRISPTVVGIDWSGAKRSGDQRKGIAAATVAPSGAVAMTVGCTRREMLDWVLELEAPVVVGFDFSFGVPKWFAHELGCRAIDEVWSAAAGHGDTWLRPTAPFWGRPPRLRCDVPAHRQFRVCEEQLADNGTRPASLFALVGPNQVGAGSVRGMALLAELRAAGYAIWPFDPPGERTVIEIYPRLFREYEDRLTPALRANPHARDAAVSALAMYEHRDEFGLLSAATDETMRLEGAVWLSRRSSSSAAR